MNSGIRWFSGLALLLGFAFASAPTHAISVVGHLGWQPVPATCSVATNVRFSLTDFKMRFQCGVAQFACVPAAPLSYNSTLQRLTVACKSNTVTDITSTWIPFAGAPAQSCTALDFDFDTREQTVSYSCTNSPSVRRICYTSLLPPVPDYIAGEVNFGYCPDAAFELIGHSGFEEDEVWRPTFGQEP